MSNGTIRSYGVSKPVSLENPTASELLSSENLEETLRTNGYFESEIELAHRIDVMSKINDLAKKWIKNVSIEKNLPAEIAENVGGGVRTFGSYRLGVHSKGGDIDTVLIAPSHIDRKDFFTSFFDLLRQQNEIRDLRSVADAFVPVIKFEFDGIELDMVFARLQLTTIPDDLNLNDDQLLINLDPWSIRSLNGCRVADEILNLIPKKETFRSTLRAIKFWAKNAGLYSNALGFFGGVTWAILVARICQLYPNATTSTLVQKFFRVYADWPWPNPIYLKMTENSRLNFPVWDPVNNPHDKQHRMPIITPSYPQQNSTHNVTRSTQKLIVQEIKRGFEIVNEIIASKSKWDRLFVRIPFFDRYKHFVLLLLSATDEDHLRYWTGLIEANIRRLIQNLEQHPSIDIAHVTSETHIPNGNVFSSEILSSGNHHTWIIGLQFQTKIVQIDFTRNIRMFKDLLENFANRNQRNSKNIVLDARYVRSRDLPSIFPQSRSTRQRVVIVENPNAGTKRKSNSSDDDESEVTKKQSRLDSVDEERENGEAS